MKDLKSIVWIAVPFVLLSFDLSIAKSKVECQLGQHYICVMNIILNNEYCYCSAHQQRKDPPSMVVKYIQANEGVDKSQLVDLDEVLQKALQESSQKVDTPVNFMVKIQSFDKKNTPPKEVEYQITTSGQ